MYILKEIIWVFKIQILQNCKLYEFTIDAPNINRSIINNF